MGQIIPPTSLIWAELWSAKWSDCDGRSRVTRGSANLGRMIERPYADTRLPPRDAEDCRPMDGAAAGDGRVHGRGQRS